MKIYLDTADIEEIQELAQSRLIDGVTTNPSLIAKEGKDFINTLKKIIKILNKFSKDFTISAEVTNTNSINDMIKEAKELSKLDKHILIKVPLTQKGLIVVKELSKKNIRCNVTLCFSTSQALLAAKAGAWCVSPFVGRVSDEGYDGIELIKEIKHIYSNYNFKTKILAASIRSHYDVREVMLEGADIITMPPSIFRKMYYNPLTNLGLEKFENDWKKYKNKQNKKN